MCARVAHSTRGSTINKKGQMSSNRALRRAKRMKQSEVLKYIDPFFRSNNVFPLQKSDEITSIMKVKGTIQFLLKKNAQNR